MYLYRREATYYFRIRIPYNIAKKLSIYEIKHSLKIKNRQKAQKIALYLAHKVDLLFDLILKRIEIMVKERVNVKKLIRDYVKKAIIEYSQLEDIRHKTYTYFDEFGKQYKGHTQEAIEVAKNQLGDIINRYDFYEMEQKAYELIERYNLDKEAFEYLPQNEKEISFAKLIKAELEVLEYDKNRNLDRLNGVSKNKDTDIKQDLGLLSQIMEQLSKETSKESQPILDISKNIHNNLIKNNILSEKINEFLDIESIARKWTPKTYNKAKLALSRLLDILGDKDLSLYVREDFEKFRSILMYLPPNFDKLKKFKDKTIIEISNINKQNEKKGEKVKKISDSSVNDIIGWVHTFLEWAYLRGYVDRNYTKSLKVKRKNSQLEDKKPFSLQDLVQLKDSVLKTAYKNKDKRPAHYWFILIGLYQGLRLEEIAQLHIEDIYQVNDIWVFDINENPNKYGEVVKSVKNNPSKRVIPIHPKLIELGFIDYFLQTKKEGHERVWYMLNRDKNGYGRNPSRWFNDNIKKYLTNHNKKSFNSTRHTFIQKCKDLSMDPYKRRGLTGRGNKEIDFTTYGEAFSPKVLLEELKKVNYDIFEDTI